MAKCSAQTENGRTCQARALRGGSLCFTHDPGSGEARAKARRLGGQRRRVGHAADPSKAPDHVRSLTDVLAVLDYSLAEALVLENSVQRGRLLVALCGSFVEAIKTGELERRLAAIESSLPERSEQHEHRR